MTGKETIEYYRNKINGNNIVRNFMSQNCDFSFGKEATLQVDKERLFKDRKCDSEVFPFGRRGDGIFALVDDSYVVYISGKRSAQKCGIVAQNTKDFFNFILKFRDAFRFTSAQNFENFAVFKKRFDERNKYLTDREKEECKAVQEFLKENEFETDIKVLYEMIKSALTAEPEFIMEDAIYNIRLNDVFGCDDDIAKLRNNTLNTYKNKIVKKTPVTKLPKFKYHPNIYDNEIVIWNEDTCDCCGKDVNEYIENVYSTSDVYCICFKCIANGAAAKKFNCTFIQDAEKVSDQEKVKELFERTPGYSNWQGEYWLACCDDYCEYIQSVGMNELDDLGITEEVLADYEKRYGNIPTEEIRESLDIDGDMMGHLFKCSHCGKYHLWIDSI